MPADLTIRIGAQVSDALRGIENIRRNIQKLASGTQQLARQTTTSFASATSATQRLSQSLQTMRERMSAVTSSMRTLSTVIATSLVGGAAMATREFMRFQTRMAEIQTIIRVSKDQLAAFGRGIREVAIESAQSFDTAARAFYQIVSAGVDASKALTVLEVSSKLAAGGLADLESTADAVTTVLNAYNVSAEQASRISDIMFKTVELGKIRVADLAAQVGRVASTAALTGVSFEELSAAIAALTATGLRAEMTMSSLGQLFQSLLNPSRELTAVIRQLGFDSGFAMLQAKGLAGTLELLTKKVGREQMAQLLGSQEAARAAFMLAGTAAERFKASLEKMHNAAGATDKAFKEVASTTEFKLRRAFLRVQNVLIEIGEEFAPIVEQFADSLSQKFKELEKSGQLKELKASLAGLVQFITDKGERVIEIITRVSRTFRQLPTSVRQAAVDVITGAGIFLLLISIFNRIRNTLATFGKIVLDIGKKLAWLLGLVISLVKWLPKLTQFLPKHPAVIIGGGAISLGAGAFAWWRARQQPQQQQQLRPQRPTPPTQPPPSQIRPPSPPSPIKLTLPPSTPEIQLETGRRQRTRERATTERARAERTPSIVEQWERHFERLSLVWDTRIQKLRASGASEEEIIRAQIQMRDEEIRERRRQLERARQLVRAKKLDPDVLLRIENELTKALAERAELTQRLKDFEKERQEEQKRQAEEQQRLAEERRREEEAAIRREYSLTLQRIQTRIQNLQRELEDETLNAEQRQRLMTMLAEAYRDLGITHTQYAELLTEEEDILTALNAASDAFHQAQKSTLQAQEILRQEQRKQLEQQLQTTQLRMNAIQRELELAQDNYPRQIELLQQLIPLHEELAATYEKIAALTPDAVEQARLLDDAAAQRHAIRKIEQDINRLRQQDAEEAIRQEKERLENRARLLQETLQSEELELARRREIMQELISVFENLAAVMKMLADIADERLHPALLREAQQFSREAQQWHKALEETFPIPPERQTPQTRARILETEAQIAEWQAEIARMRNDPKARQLELRAAEKQLEALKAQRTVAEQIANAVERMEKVAQIDYEIARTQERIRRLRHPLRADIEESVSRFTERLPSAMFAPGGVQNLLRDFIQELRETFLRHLFQPLIDALKKVLTNLVTQLSTWLAKLLARLPSILQITLGSLGLFGFGGLLRPVTEAIEGVWKAVSKPLRPVGELVEGAWKVITSPFRALFGGGKKKKSPALQLTPVGVTIFAPTPELSVTSNITLQVHERELARVIVRQTL